MDRREAAHQSESRTTQARPPPGRAGSLRLTLIARQPDRDQRGQGHRRDQAETPHEHPHDLDRHQLAVDDQAGWLAADDEQHGEGR